ncbi:MAG: PqqD family protein [Candidatus Nitrotoga sp.]
MKKPQNQIFCHRPGLDTCLVEEDVFVITRTTIKHVNATAAIVWLLLDEPITRHDLLSVLKTTYPDVSKQRLAADLGKLLNELLQSNLIRIIKPPAAPRRKGKNSLANV